MKRTQTVKSKWMLALCCLLWLNGFRLAAATHSVTNENESALRAAIAQAAPGDTIKVDISDLRKMGSNVFVLNNIIYLTNGEMVINKDLTIIGVATNGTNYPIINGQWLTRVFKVENGTVMLCNLTIVNGNASNAIPPMGAGIYNRGSLTLSNCSFMNNQTTAPIGTNTSGGGIYNHSTLTAIDSVFNNNSCTAHGGGLYNGGTASILSCTFTNNRARWQGGGIDNAGTLTLVNSTFIENYALSSGGGGVGNQSNALACINNCKFLNNTNEYYGGGGIINFGSLFMTNTSLAGNMANKDSGDTGTSGGGGLFNSSGTAVLQSCVIGPNNWSQRGGGILNFGAVTSAPAILMMSACTLYSNNVSTFGGGLMNWSCGGPATTGLTNCTISLNYVDFQDYTAGGIDNTAYIGPALINIMNCTLASNVISAALSADTIASSLFSGVFGDDPSASANINLANSILCGSVLQAAQARVYAPGTLTSLGYNICSDVLSPISSASDRRGLNPQINALIPVGSIWIHPLKGNSPGLNTGNPANTPAFDARGFARPFGPGYDIGAVEQTLWILNLSATNFFSGGTNLSLFFTPYVYPTNYVAEYSTNLLPGSWKAFKTNLVTSPGNVMVTHSKGGPAVGTSPRYFYRVRTQ